MPRTRIKICGVTRQGDAVAAVRAGADAIGLVFYPGSSRALDLVTARAVVAGLPPFVSVVGLFVDAREEMVRDACNALPLSLLQFHGEESRAYCEQFGLPYMKAVRVAQDSDVRREILPYKSACAILLDTWKSGQPGGTGERFDWGLVPQDLGPAIVLAGGLNDDNVGAAIAQLGPYAVDVSGGVEESPGCKSAEKIERFVAAVRRADSGK